MSHPKLIRLYSLNNGMEAAIITNDFGCYCGYVGVGKNHPLHGQVCNNVWANVHGGITYSGDEVFGVEKSDVWWFGFAACMPTDRTCWNPNGRKWTLEEIEKQILSMSETLIHRSDV